MDRLVKFVGNGPAIIINPRYVRTVTWAATGHNGKPYTNVSLRGTKDPFVVAGTPEQVAEALGYQLVTFNPATGLSEGSEEAS